MRKAKKTFGFTFGETVKYFVGTVQNGNSIQLSELLKKGKVVIVFYRGQWCTICMPHIKNRKTAWIN